MPVGAGEGEQGGSREDAKGIHDVMQDSQPLIADSGLTSASSSSGSHLFEQAFADRQRKESDESSFSVPRNASAFPQETAITSPSSILNAYSRPSIEQGSNSTRETQAGQYRTSDLRNTLASSDEGIGARSTEPNELFEDDTIKLNGRFTQADIPSRPRRPARTVPVKPPSTETSGAAAPVLASYHETASPSSKAPSNTSISRTSSLVRSRSINRSASHKSASERQSSPNVALPPSSVSPTLDISSTSSSSSSHFFSNGDSFESMSSASTGDRNSHLYPGDTEHLRKNPGLEVNGFARSSNYTSVTSASEWARENEEAMRNSRSAIFDLEDELTSREEQLAAPIPSSSQNTDAQVDSQPLSMEQLGPSAEKIAAPSPSPRSLGFGLGITSDDAIHPDNPSLPSSSFPSPAVSAGYASDSFFPRMPNLASAPLPPQPVSAGPALVSDTMSSRWSTTVPYRRRNTTSSVRSIHRVASKPSLVEQGNAPKQLRHATSHASLVESRGTSSTPLQPVSQVLRSNSTTYQRIRKTRPREPSFSAFSTSSNGHAALATLSYAESNPHSSYQDRSRASSVSMSEAFEENPEELEELLPESALHSSAASACFDRPRSQAVALVENGRSEIVRLAQGEPVHEVFVGANTTHLILPNANQPVEMRYLLDASLPSIAQSLVVLDISNGNLSALPDSLTLCSNLEELNISHNPLLSGTLPPWTIALTSLRLLMADSCALASLSHSLAPLKELHTLSVKDNHLKSLPSWLRHLSESLEVLLLNGNPWFGDYAILAKSLEVQQASAMPPYTAVCKTSAGHRYAAAALTSPSLTDLYDETVYLAPGTLPSPPPTSPSQFSGQVGDAPSPRSSFMSRARSYRAGLRRPSTLSSSDTEDNATHSVILSDSGSRSSSLTRRASVLRPMRSMGDLAMPQPSIHSLVDSRDSALESQNDDFGRSTMPARSKASSSRGMTIGEFFQNGASEEVYQQSHGNTTYTPESNGYESTFESTEDTDVVPERTERERKPSFFRKISMVAKERKAKMDRKRSQSISGREKEKDDNKEKKGKKGKDLPVPDMPKDLLQTSLGKGRPIAPFMSEDMRSSSAPAVTGRSIDGRHARPGTLAETSSSTLERQASFSASMKASTIGKTRPSKLSKPGPQALTDSKVTKHAKRRSYLMLDSILPEVSSPGPLTMTFTNRSTEDATVHAKPFGIARDDDTIILPRVQETEPIQSLPEVRPAVDADVDEARVRERKAALAPLMAYLRDLDELLPEIPVSIPEGDGDESLSPVLQRSRMTQKKASSAALSTASSLPDRSSGYESIAESSRIASPASLQEPIKWKDSPVKREHVISEIISSEKSYLAGLQELVSLYIQPASAPIRSSSNHSAARETYISQTERNMVFGVAESIAQYHATIFLPELEKAAVFVTGDRKSITSLDGMLLRQAAEEVAKVFSQQAAVLKIYHSYCMNFDTALERLALWQSFTAGNSTPLSASSPAPDPATKVSANQVNANQRKRIRDLLKTAKRDTRHRGLNLQSYLLLPIQRIPRYRMLLEQLLECTPDPDNPSLPDPSISAAQQSISELATEMNEKKRDSEGRKRLLHWQGRLGKEFKSPLLQPHRNLLKEGTMTISRIAKRTSTIVPSSLGDSGESALVQINFLSIDTTPKQLHYLLCNDILVLMIASGYASGPVVPYTILWLGKALGGRTDPASIFQDMLRVVDYRAILYLTCSDITQARECRDIMNQQSRLNEQSLAVAAPSIQDA